MDRVLDWTSLNASLLGLKDTNTNPPSSVGCFQGGCPAGF